MIASLVACLFFTYSLADSGIWPAALTSTTPCHPEKYHPSLASYHLEQINARQIVRGAADVADQVKSRSPSNAKGIPTVVLFLSDAKYEVRFPEMIKTWSQFAGKSSLVMLALDNATDVFCHPRVSRPSACSPRRSEHSIREAVLQAKVVVPYVFLLKGMWVVMVEMDIYCRSNPLRFDNGTAEILVTEHDNTREVNVTSRVRSSTRSAGCRRGSTIHIVKGPIMMEHLIKR